FVRSLTSCAPTVPGWPPSIYYVSKVTRPVRCITPAGALRITGPALETLVDARIADRRHNPPYGLFAVVTFMPRVRGSKQADSCAVIGRAEGEIVGSSLFCMPDKTKRELPLQTGN